jgi:hypothetical protein
MHTPNLLVTAAAWLRAPQRGRLLQAAAIGAGIVATIALYGVYGRPGGRRIAIVVQQSAAASPAPATSSATASPAARATAAATRQARATTSATATPSPDQPPDIAALLPPGAAVSDQLELRDETGRLTAVVVTGTLAASGDCAAAFLQLFARDGGGWAVRFDGASAPAGGPWFAEQTAANCVQPPQLAPLGVPTRFVAASMQLADGSARLIALDASGAALLDLHSVGAAGITTPNSGTIELDQPPAATDGGPVSAAGGMLARVVSVADGEPVVRARLLPNCDRGRLQPGSAAAINVAAGGGAGTVTIACSSGAHAAALVDGDTLLDLIAAPASAVHDNDYVELGYDDGSLNVNPTSNDAPPLPRLALLTDNTAALRGAAPPARATAPARAAPTRPPAASSRSSNPAAQPYRPQPASTRAPASSSSAGGSSGVPAAAAPTRPVATRPALQPPAPPGGAAGSAPP